MADGKSRRERAKQKCRDCVKAARDRRRRVRKRLEEIFGRKQFMGVVVAGSMGKCVETGLVPFLDPTASVPLGRLFSWIIVFSASVLVAVRWEHLANYAEAAGEAVEEAVDTEGS